MSSRSKRSPQPEPRPPRLLITEVRAAERAGEVGESHQAVEISALSRAQEAGADEASSNRVMGNQLALLVGTPESSEEEEPAKVRAKARRAGAASSKGAAAKAAVKAAPVKRAAAKVAQPKLAEAKVGVESKAPVPTGPEVKVRRIHRRDLNRTWEFLKMVFRDVNRETVEYQRPRSKLRFTEVYEEDGEQLLFEIDDKIVGYAECAFDASGADNWINPRYFDKRGMRPLYVDELAVHPDYQGRGVGGFMLDQVQHLARVRGCTHLVLEVAENNKSALSWYHKRNFFRLDAAIFLAQKVPAEPELLPPRRLPQKRATKGKTAATPAKGSRRASTTAASRTRKR